MRIINYTKATMLQIIYKALLATINHPKLTTEAGNSFGLIIVPGFKSE